MDSSIKTNKRTFCTLWILSIALLISSCVTSVAAERPRDVLVAADKAQEIPNATKRSRDALKVAERSKVASGAGGCPNVDPNLPPGRNRMLALLASAMHLNDIQGKHGVWLCTGEALDLAQQLLPQDHEQILLIQLLYAQVGFDLGWYSDAEPHLREVLRARHRTLEQNDPRVSEAQFNLSKLLARQGRFAEAEKHYRNILRVLDETDRRGGDHYATILNSLGVIHLQQARISDGRELIERAKSIWENRYGSNDWRIGISLEGLAEAANLEGDLVTAERHLKRSIEIVDANEGRENRSAELNIKLADIQIRQGNKSTVLTILQSAEKQFRNSRTIKTSNFEFVLPLDGPAFAFDINLQKSTAKYHRSIGQYDRALDFLRGARVTQRKLLGQNLAHAELIDTHFLMAESYFTQGAIDQALSTGRMMFDGLKERLLVGAGDGFDPRFRALRRSYRDAFSLYVEILITAHERDKGQDYQVHAFEVAQWARVSQAATALDRMAARLAASNTATSNLVRQRQDTIDQYRHLERALVEEYSAPAGFKIKNHQEDLDRLTLQLERIGDELQENYPAYFSLITPSVLSAATVKTLLEDREVLIAPFIGSTSSFLFVVDNQRVSSYRIPATIQSVAKSVHELRRSINNDGIANYVPPAFNLSEAYDLFRTVFEPAWNTIKVAEHLIIIPDGALETIPLSVLTSDPPPETGNELKDYELAGWLDEQFTISSLPSVGSLKALRAVASPSKAKRQFLGVGNPSNLKVPISSGEFTVRAISSADFRNLRALWSLPETEDEIKALAASFGGSPMAKVLLGSNATEAQLIKLNTLKELQDFRVLAFATHSFATAGIASDGYAEPGLVLSLPDAPTNADDGFLSSSDVASLELDADWVLLSACNTAAGDGSVESASLSGLARAFLYAGTRSLLVSHWYVNDTSTADLIKLMAEQDLSSSQSLAKSLGAAKRAMRQSHGGKFAHPNYWAPFSIIGM